MSIQVVTNREFTICDVEVERVKSGTLIGNLPSYPSTLYIVVSDNTWKNVKLKRSNKYVVVMNIKTGQLREIHGRTIVTTLLGKLEVEESFAINHLKPSCSRENKSSSQPQLYVQEPLITENNNGLTDR